MQEPTVNMRTKKPSEILIIRVQGLGSRTLIDKHPEAPGAEASQVRGQIWGSALRLRVSGLVCRAHVLNVGFGGLGLRIVVSVVRPP